MSEGAIRSPFLDEPRWRLVWIFPLALALWSGMLFGFSKLLEEPRPRATELKPLQARILEIPPPAGLQGGPAPVAKPEPRVLPKPLVRPRVERHIVRAKPMAPPAPPSPEGTAKTEAPAAAPSAPAGAAPGVSGGSGTGSGAGLGSDSTGARALFAPLPQIPDDLRDQAFQTTALAHFKVSAEGQAQVTLAQPTPNPRLNQILLDTLNQWKFLPAMRDGIAIDAEFDVRIPISVQ